MPGDFRGKTIFPPRPKMLIFANQRQNDEVDSFYVCVKTIVSESQLEKKNGQTRTSESSKILEKQILGP